MLARDDGIGPTVRLRDFKARRGRFSLGPIDVDLPPGRVALVGLNGVGKSTLIRSLVGASSFRGSICVNGSEVPFLPPAQTGFVPQENDFPALLTVAECISMAADLKGVPDSGRGDAVRLALRAVGLEGHAGARASRLSGGERRRLACAQGIVHDPNILLLDEPTAGLDPLQRERLRDFLHSLPTQTLVVVTTHILEDVAEWADRFLVLDDGCIVHDVMAERMLRGERLATLTSLIRGRSE